MNHRQGHPPPGYFSFTSSGKCPGQADGLMIVSLFFRRVPLPRSFVDFLPVPVPVPLCGFSILFQPPEPLLFLSQSVKMFVCSHSVVHFSVSLLLQLKSRYGMGRRGREEDPGFIPVLPLTSPIPPGQLFLAEIFGNCNLYICRYFNFRISHKLPISEKLQSGNYFRFFTFSTPP